MTEVNCWACRTPLKKRQKICLECNSWQDWRRHISISNTSLALLIALFSVVTLVGTKFLEFYDELHPELEIHLSGHFDTKGQVITLNAYNFGTVPANLASNIRCTFGLENAMGHAKSNEGVEVEFWTTDTKMVPPNSALEVDFIPQFSDFDPSHYQVLCFGALEYFDRSGQVEPFFLSIAPETGHTWWPIESWATTEENVELLYPRKVDF